ncbi:glycosyltransferase family 4 protein [Methanolobus sp. WCC5]|uniref:glycosyltransferase family 4 protein n=1 Tax=Methanolobus sp. WCC5 TaxID=3125785 RepID=UPI00324CC4BA
MKVIKMKVCFVTPYSPKEITGVSTFLENLTLNLKELGTDSIVITKRVIENTQTNTKMVEINCNSIPMMKDLYLAIHTSLEIARMRKSISLIHLQTPLPQSAFSALTAKLLRLPVITTIHGRYPPLNSFIKKKFYQIMEKITILASEKLVFVSDDVRQDFNFRRGEVILNGVDIKKIYFNQKVRNTKRAELGIDKNEVVFIYVGRWVAHKGIYHLLESFAELIKEGKKAKLIFIGTGESKELQDEIGNKNLTQSVLLVGKVDHIRDYLCAADLFVLYTSNLEGLPLALLEAMACRVVPIATDVSGIPEVINNNKNGFLIKEGKIEDLKQKMSWSIDNFEQINAMKLNSEATIVSKYNIQRMTEEYLQLYKKVLE